MLTLRRPELVPPNELPRCDFCHRRIPSTKRRNLRKKKGRHQFCSNPCYGAWMRGRPLKERLEPMSLKRRLKRLALPL